MQLSIIIVSYNVREILLQCLCSLKQAGTGLKHEIIVADNDSSDQTVEILTPLFPDVKFIRSGQNLGFARANNLALQQAQGQYVLFLNPDTLVTEACLQNCITYLQTHNGTGAVGVKMIDGFGRFLAESKRATPSLTASLFKLAGLARLFPHSRIFNRYALGNLNANDTHEIDILAGAFMMIPREVLTKTGGFNEAYFMYGEDIDLCLRIQQAGYTIAYLGNNRIIHFKGQSLRRGSVKHTNLFYQAMVVFVRQHYQLAFLMVPFIHLFRIMTLVRNLFLPSSTTDVHARLTAKGLMILGEQQEHLPLLHKGMDTSLAQLFLPQRETYATVIAEKLAGMQHFKQVIFVLPDISLEEASKCMEQHPGPLYRFITRSPYSFTFNSENSQF